MCHVIMNKNELIREVAQKTGMTIKDTAAACDAFIEAVSDALAAHDTVALAGFGSFTTPYREEHQARNPRTGEAMTVKGGHSVRFKAGKALKTKVDC